MVSLCTGAFALAEAGLLDGRRATARWLHTVQRAERYPKVQVDDSVLYVDDGDVLTSAGLTAGLDLCLHLVRRDHGAHVANRLARRMVVPARRPGGQAQFIDLSVPETDDDALAPVLDWARSHLDQPIAVGGLARRAATSPRTFYRRLQEATGSTPLRWLLAQRPGRVQDLLESTKLSIEKIGEPCGRARPTTSATTSSTTSGCHRASTGEPFRRRFQAPGPTWSHNCAPSDDTAPPVCPGPQAVESYLGIAQMPGDATRPVTRWPAYPQHSGGTDTVLRTSGLDPRWPAAYVTLDTGPLLWKRKPIMRAHLGDQLIIESPTTDVPRRDGEIVGLHHEDGRPPYDVRWSDTGDVTLVFPGPDAHVRHLEQERSAASHERSPHGHR